MEVKILDENNIDTKLFGIVSGRSGVGKTYQASTLPKKTLLVSLEQGHLTLRGSGIRYIEPTSYNELYSYLQTMQHIPDFIYVDSLTELYDLLRHEARKNYKPSQNYAKHEDIEDKLLSFLRFCRNLPCSVFFTCHTKQDKDALGMVETLAFDGKMPTKVLKQFDFSFHLMIDEKGNRFFETSPVDSLVAKARVSEFLKVKLEAKEEANLYKLCKKLLGR